MNEENRVKQEEGKSSEDDFFELLEGLEEEAEEEEYDFEDLDFSDSKTETFSATEERKIIENEGLRQDNKMRMASLRTLFYFLFAETFVIFTFTFFQAIKRPWGFSLEEWSFKLLITATISQITAMLIIAIRYLFKDKKDN